MNMPSEVLDRFLALFRRTPAVRKVYLFGSRARGNHRYNSDIDLAIQFSAEADPDFFLELDDSAGLHTLDVINLDEIEDSLLLQEIMNHHVVLHEKHS